VIGCPRDRFVDFGGTSMKGARGQVGLLTWWNAIRATAFANLRFLC